MPATSRSSRPWSRARSRSRSSESGGSPEVADHADAVRVIANGGIVAQAARAGDVVLAVAPRPATQHAGGALPFEPRRAVERRTGIGSHPAVLDPLGNTAAGVAQAERIGRERADLGGLVTIPRATAIAAAGLGRADSV